MKTVLTRQLSFWTEIANITNIQNVNFSCYREAKRRATEEAEMEEEQVEPERDLVSIDTLVCSIRQQVSTLIPSPYSW